MSFIVHDKDAYLESFKRVKPCAPKINRAHGRRLYDREEKIKDWRKRKRGKAYKGCSPYCEICNPNRSPRWRNRANHLAEIQVEDYLSS